MWLTREEARMKWCPLGRESDPCTPESVTNRECGCVASSCMMWRERIEDDGTMRWPVGYCGMAGRPE